MATPNAPLPKRATLRVFETREIWGLVFAWWGIGGRQPQWDLPPDPEDSAVWSSLQDAKHSDSQVIRRKRQRMAWTWVT